jgi:membrane-associated phospholipid phosphatase
MAKYTKRISHVFFLLILVINQLSAQNDTIIQEGDSKKNIPWALIVPSTMISYGIITRFCSDLQDFDKEIDNKILQNIQRKYRFDDYIQYAPYVGIYGLDFCGVTAKNNILNRTLVLGTSIIICTSVVQITKHTVDVLRPDGSNYHSFPSGHTATAFLGAHILFKEYKDVSPYIGVAGYGIAAITGSMRIINRKHWFSDVLIGAGIGIISVELSYLMLPLWNKLFDTKSKLNHFTFSPVVGNNYYGIGGILTF